MSVNRQRFLLPALATGLFLVTLLLQACAFTTTRPTAVAPVATAATMTGGATTTTGASPRAASPGASPSPALAGGPPGSVGAGEVVYLQAGGCVNCHGANLDGNNGAFPPLTGRAAIQDFPTTQLLFDYIKRSMPYLKPGSLSDQQVYDVIAYLLSKNGLVPDTFVANGQTLSTVKLPGSDPNAPPLAGAPATPHPITPGSSQAAPTVSR